MTTRLRVSAQLDLRLDAPGDLTLSVAAAGGCAPDAEETLSVTQDGHLLDPVAATLEDGTRLHLVSAGQGELRVSYGCEAAAAVAGRGREITAVERVLFTRPSRYCPSDRVGGLAAGELGHLAPGRALTLGVEEWVNRRLVYVSGSSQGTDDAVDTLLSGAGVCRDYAHVVVTLLRALDVPARFVSVYAGGLYPMDFHAVVEAEVDGRWQLLDASRLAPRTTMVRIATGRDAADTAFLTTSRSGTTLLGATVTAVADPTLPQDDPETLVALP